MGHRLYGLEILRASLGPELDVCRQLDLDRMVVDVMEARSLKVAKWTDWFNLLERWAEGRSVCIALLDGQETIHVDIEARTAQFTG